MKVTRISGSNVAEIFRHKYSGDILGLGMIRSVRSKVAVRVVYAGEREPEKLTSGIQYICAGKGVLVDDDDSLQIYAFPRQRVLARLSPESWFEIDLSKEKDAHDFHLRIRMLIDSIEGRTNLFGESENMLQYVGSVLSDPMESELKRVVDLLRPFHSHPIFSRVFKLITELVEAGELLDAIKVIGDYFNSSSGLVQSRGYTAEYFKIKSDVLSELLLHVETEKNFAEKKLFTYHAAYSSILSGAILKVYRLRIDILQEKVKENPELRKNLEEVMDEYDVLLEIRKCGDKVFFLGIEEKREIRKLFKKAVKYCHPDIVGPNKKDAAQDVFHRLKSAFDRNDIRAVREIYSQVKSGVLLSKDDDVQSIYVQQLIAFKDVYINYEDTISSPLYQRIKDQQDFDDILKVQLRSLEREIDHMQDELYELKRIYM